jgi:hypothetical protein
MRRIAPIAHQITPGPQSDIVICSIQGELTYDDMTCVEELGLNEGRPVYILLDVTKMEGGLPPDFLDGARKSWFTHENTAHLALFADSHILRMVGTMVAKLTRRADKLSTHETYAGALGHLQQLAR